MSTSRATTTVRAMLVALASAWSASPHAVFGENASLLRRMVASTVQNVEGIRRASASNQISAVASSAGVVIR